MRFISKNNLKKAPPASLKEAMLSWCAETGTNDIGLVKVIEVPQDPAPAKNNKILDRLVMGGEVINLIGTPSEELADAAMTIFTTQKYKGIDFSKNIYLTPDKEQAVVMW